MHHTLAFSTKKWQEHCCQNIMAATNIKIDLLYIYFIYTSVLDPKSFGYGSGSVSCLFIKSLLKSCSAYNLPWGGGDTYKGNLRRLKGVAWHIIDMVLLFRLPIPVGVLHTNPSMSGMVSDIPITLNTRTTPFGCFSEQLLTIPKLRFDLSGYHLTFRATTAR